MMRFSPAKHNTATVWALAAMTLLPLDMEARLPNHEELRNASFSEGTTPAGMPVDWYVQKDSTANVTPGENIRTESGETPLAGVTTFVRLERDESPMKIALASGAIPDPKWGAVGISFHARSVDRSPLILNLLPEPWPDWYNYFSRAYPLESGWQQFNAYHNAPFGNHAEARFFIDFIHEQENGAIDITGIQVNYLAVEPAPVLRNGNFASGITSGGLPVSWYILSENGQELLTRGAIRVEVSDDLEIPHRNYLRLVNEPEISGLHLGSTAFPFPEEGFLDVEFLARSPDGVSMEVRLASSSNRSISFHDSHVLELNPQWTFYRLDLRPATGEDRPARVFLSLHHENEAGKVDVTGFSVRNSGDPPAMNLLPEISPDLRADWPGQDTTSYQRARWLRALAPTAATSIPGASHFEEVVYIDPTANTEGTGQSPDDPVNSWDKVVLQSGKAYLQKCGSEAILENRLVTPSNILLGAYGKGPRPLIRVTESLQGDRAAIEAGLTQVTIRDLHIEAPALSSVIKLGASQTVVYNCELAFSHWGMRGYGENYTIHRTIVREIKDDGLFLQNASGVDLGWNYIFRVNTLWEDPYTPQTIAGGDCVQLESCRDVSIHHNVFDRTSSGNKFGLISNNGKGQLVIENNFIAGPRPDGDGGAAVYLGRGQTGVVLGSNHIERAVHALYSHVEGLVVTNNIFTDCGGGIWSGTENNTIEHNTFHNIRATLVKDGGIMRNNIFDNPHDGTNTISRIQDMTHNLFTRESFGDSSNFVGDPAYVDSERNNFRLRAQSAAVDQGQPTGLGTDADGNPRTQSDAPDIGAYEYFGAPAFDWITVYHHWDNGWKYTPYGLVYDNEFPWCYWAAWPEETGKSDGFWFYLAESKEEPDGFLAYDSQHGRWFWGFMDAAPLIFSYAGSAGWIRWGM